MPAGGANAAGTDSPVELRRQTRSPANSGNSTWSLVPNQDQMAPPLFASPPRCLGTRHEKIGKTARTGFPIGSRGRCRDPIFRQRDHNKNASKRL
jgi:hypothetical protein